MTLDDKIALCSGKNFWETKAYEKYGIPSLFMSDGPHGLRKQNLDDGADMLGINKSLPATCFPAEVTTASSWDVDLLERIGQSLGKEAVLQKVGLVLGPGANIKRNPLCGRNFEYFSEDPYLAGKLAGSFIHGIESQGIGTSLKHFACNSQERDRFTSDSILDERSLRELYLTGFELAVKEGKPSTIMCAYNKLNGIHCSDNIDLLTDILRDEWGFEGMVVTDWGAMNDRIEGFKAGCDLNMPGGSAFMEKEVKQAVLDGALSEALIDESVRRILKLVFRADKTLKESGEDCFENNHKMAVEAACKGGVLLKNEDKLLPISDGDNIAVVGYMAKHMRYQGAGSSHINPTKIEAPLDFFPEATYVAGCDEKGDTDVNLLAQVAQAADKADKVIVFAGLPDSYESEGFDRDDMRMPQGHLQMIQEAAAHNDNVIVILLSGSVVECPWADQVKSILYMGLPGQGGAEAIYKLVTGLVNPSGRLAETWPYTYDDVPSSDYYGQTKDGLYKEGLYVGYRYYDKAGINVRWPFGYGLSYTTFAYSDLALDGNRVRVMVTNTGDRFGEEVIELFVGKAQEGIHRPKRELKRFKKIELNPNESVEVTFELDDRCFAIWHGGFEIEDGTYEISIGDMSLTKYVEGRRFDKLGRSGWYEHVTGKPDMESFEKAIGRKYIEPVLKKGSFTMDNTVEEMKDFSLIMKIMYKATESVIAKGFGGKVDYSNPDFKMMMKSSAGGPLRSMQISSGKQGGLFEGLLDMANGHMFRGLIKMMRK
ncbi:MAG: beta-glucosidase [Lachnospiraceae bacterium]|nr:beta-glucosidase [Lachnospiraceae bacterium]